MADQQTGKTQKSATAEIDHEAARKHPPGTATPDGGNHAVPPDTEEATPKGRPSSDRLETETNQGKPTSSGPG